MQQAKKIALFSIAAFFAISCLESLSFAQPSGASLVQVEVQSDTIAPAPPTDLTATAGDTTTDLSWTTNNETDLAGYRIYRSQTHGGPYEWLNDVFAPENTYTDEYLSPGTYYYVVTAWDSFGNESGYSGEVSVVIVIATPPLVPQGLSAVYHEDIEAVDLQWLPNSESDLSHYNIYRSYVSGGPYEYWGYSINAFFSDYDIFPNETYYYVVTAVDFNGNESGYSTETSANSSDTIAPLALITSPQENDTLSEYITIVGTATDNKNIDYGASGLYYGKGSSSTEWILIDYLLSEGEGVTLAEWDTSYVENGAYTIKLSVVDDAGNESVDTTVVTVNNNFAMAPPFVSLPFFSPNGDNNKDLTVIKSGVAEPEANWSIIIKDSGQNEVKQFTGQGGAINQIWDGTNTQGQIVPDGAYTVYVSASYNGNVLGPLTTTVVVDNTPPVAEITSPQDGGIIWGKVDILGTANDDNFYWSSLEWSNEADPASWNYLSDNLSPVINNKIGEWRLSCANGQYFLRLTVEDKAGNKSEDIVAVNLKKIEISEVSTTPLFIDPFAGEASTISFVIDQQANITIKIYRFFARDELNLIATPVNNVPCSSGVNSFTWDGKGSVGHIVYPGLYTYVIEARGVEGSGGDYSSPLYSSVQEFTDIVIDSNFDPYKGELCKISYSLTDPAIVTIYITDATEPHSIKDVLLLAAPRPAGTNIEYWDGRSYYYELNPPYKLKDKITSGPFAVKGSMNRLTDNFIAIRNDSFKVTALSAEAYSIMPLYNEIGKINYSFSKDAKVRIKIYDPSDNCFRTLQDDTLIRNAGSYSVEWDGTDNNGEYVATEGNYTIEVTLTDAESNTVSRKGNIAVYK